MHHPTQLYISPCDGDSRSTTRQSHRGISYPPHGAWNRTRGVISRLQAKACSYQVCAAVAIPVPSPAPLHEPIVLAAWYQRPSLRTSKRRSSISNRRQTRPMVNRMIFHSYNNKSRRGPSGPNSHPSRRNAVPKTSKDVGGEQACPRDSTQGGGKSLSRY